MRLLLVLATSDGGVARHVRQLADGLAEAGLVVTIAGPREPSPGAPTASTAPSPPTDPSPPTAAAREEATAGAGFVPVDIADRPRPVADLRAVRRLRALAAGSDVVHAHGLRAGALAVLAARTLPAARRPRLVVTLHNALVSSGTTAAVHGVLERVVARGADVVLAVSDDVGAAITARGARHVEPAVIPAPELPPPSTPRDAVRERLGVDDETPLLVTVARLAPQKGLDILVEAVARLRRQGVQVTAVVAGGGPLHGTLQRQIEELDAPVRLIGSRDDVADLLAAADLVVVPSRWEGQPLVVAEALRAGRPLVATDVGGVRAMTSGAARLVPAGDAEALAAALGSLLADPAAMSELQRHAAGAAARLPAPDSALRHVVRVYQG